MESDNLATDWSEEEDRRACEFVTKIKVFDEDINHRGIFKQYTTAMKLYKSGTYNVVDLKNIIAIIFRDCETLLVDFNQLLKDFAHKNAHDDVADDASNYKRFLEFVKTVSRDCKELRGEFIEAFDRHKEHQDAQILRNEIDQIFQNYPSLKEEFRMILLGYGYEIKGEEITDKEEDELYDDDMYIKCIESAIRFEAAEDNEKPPVAVYGAIRRFYEQCRRPIPQDSMKNLKLAIQRILPALKRKHMELLEKRDN